MHRERKINLHTHTLNMENILMENKYFITEQVTVDPNKLSSDDGLKIPGQVKPEPDAKHSTPDLHTLQFRTTY